MLHRRRAVEEYEFDYLQNKSVDCRKTRELLLEDTLTDEKLPNITLIE